jgi:tetratricopeptide (TPR) repeat protein
LDSRSQGAYINRGLANLYQGSLAEALDDFEAAIRMNTENVDALYNAGLALTWQGRIEEASVRFEAALRLDSKYVSALYWLGIVHIVQQNYSRAAGMFDRVLELQPSNESAERFRALALEIQATGAKVDNFNIQMGPISVKVKLQP